MATTKPAAAPASKPSGGGCETGCLPVCTLEKAMNILISNYHRFCATETIDDCFTQKEMTEFLKCQTPTFLAACNRNNPKYMEKLFKEADLNKDKKVCFEEFTKVLCIMADDAHRMSHGHDRCGPDKD